MIRLVLKVLFVGAFFALPGCYPGGAEYKPLSPRPSGQIKEGIHEGNRAPEIAGEDADDNSLKLSDYRGKVVLLDFWAGW
jgi:hypothetical protein